MLKEH
jgi:hypothetical protein